MTVRPAGHCRGGGGRRSGRRGTRGGDRVNRPLTSERVAALVVGALLAAGCTGGRIGGDWKPAFFEDCLYWSGDGSALAVGRHPSVGSDEPPGIRVYDMHGDTLRRLTTDDLTVVAWPAGRRELVAFDGRALVFVSVRDGSRRPLMDVAARLPEARDAAVLPSPALDSVLLSFQRPSPTDDPLDYRDEIWVVDPKTRTATMVSRPGEKFASNPSWSPDGSGSPTTTSITSISSGPTAGTTGSFPRRSIRRARSSRPTGRPSPTAPATGSSASTSPKGKAGGWSRERTSR